MMPRVGLGGMVCLLASGCGVTEVAVVVRTDLAVGSALAAVRILGANPPYALVPNAPEFDTGCVRVGDAPPSVRPPLVLGVQLDPSAHGKRFTVLAKGYADPLCARASVVQQSATAAFVSGQIRRLDLALLAACVGVPCPTGETCRGPAAHCVSDEVGPLAPFDATALPPGGDPVDGAALASDGGPRVD